ALPESPGGSSTLAFFPGGREGIERVVGYPEKLPSGVMRFLTPDLDGDGYPDLVLCASSPLSYYRGGPDGFRYAGEILEGSYSDRAMAACKGSGSPQVIAAGIGPGGHASTILEHPKLDMVTWLGNPPILYGPTGSMAAADFDGDRFCDLVLEDSGQT